MAPDSKEFGAIPFAIYDTACWNVLGIRILVIRVCQRHALCNRRVGWDIPELDCITRSNATVREGWAIGPVDCGYLHDSDAWSVGAVRRSHKSKRNH